MLGVPHSSPVLMCPDTIAFAVEYGTHFEIVFGNAKSFFDFPQATVRGYYLPLGLLGIGNIPADAIPM